MTPSRETMMIHDSHNATPPAKSTDTPAIIDPITPLCAVLGQVEALLGGLTQEKYIQNPVGTFKSSIGGHVRHCLDHIEALLMGAGGFIDYDKRSRGTRIETNRNAALRETHRLSQALTDLDHRSVSEELVVSLMLSGDGPPIHWRSTLGREMAFVLSHTIHHGAMIGAMAEQLGAQVPEGFGLAPSTIAYRAGR